MSCLIGLSSVGFTMLIWMIVYIVVLHLFSLEVVLLVAVGERVMVTVEILCDGGYLEMGLVVLPPVFSFY